MSEPKWRAGMDIVAAIAMTAASCSILWAIFLNSSAPARDGGREAAPALPTEPIRVTDAAAVGVEDAKVVLVVFSDFQCPYCATFAREVFPKLVDEYVGPGKLRIYFKHFPLTAIHPLATRAAEVAECARRQGRFWQVHDALFGIAPRFSESQLLSTVESLGVQRNQLKACLGDEVRRVVAENSEEATRLGFKGTPGFLVGTIQSDGRLRPTQRVAGAKPVDVFRKALDQAIEGAASRD